jgi:hypothetical protein
MGSLFPMEARAFHTLTRVAALEGQEHVFGASLKKN